MITTLAHTPLVNRSIELLTGFHPSLANPASSTGDLAALGAVLSTVETAAEGDPRTGSAPDAPDAVAAGLLNVGDAAGNASGPTSDGAEIASGALEPGGLLGPVTTVADRAVLAAHAELELAGHEIPPLDGTLHGLTNLGETIGLGHLGQAPRAANLVTDAVHVPEAVLDGYSLTSATAPVVTDVGNIVGATEHLARQALEIGATGNGLLGHDGLLSPVTNIANGGVLGFHAALEGTVDGTGILIGPSHALTTLGETIGLGHIGDANLVTNTVALPSHALDGNGPAAVESVLAHAANTTVATGNLVDSVVQEVGGSSGGGLGAPIGSVRSGIGGQGPGGNLVDTVTQALGGGTGLAGNGLPAGLGAGPGTGGGAQPLIGAEAGHQTANPLAIVDLLAPIDPAPNVVDIGVLTTPQGQTPLLDLAVLDSLAIPAGTGGADGLVGRVLDLTPVAGPAPDLGGGSGTGPGLGIDVAGLDFHFPLAGDEPGQHQPLHGLV